MVMKLKKGIDLPLAGEPSQHIVDAPPPKQVALLGVPYVGMKPTMKVRAGDKVKIGQPLWVEKNDNPVVFVAPASGTVIEVNRGYRRALLSVTIENDGKNTQAKNYKGTPADKLASLKADAVRTQLLESGAWTALRTRPYSKIPQSESTPSAIFVTATDTNPLTADPKVYITEKMAEFKAGLAILKHLTDGTVYVCHDGSWSLDSSLDGVEQHAFVGPHPAGNAGTHIHFLRPVDCDHTVWTIGYQDVIAWGHLFVTGQIMTERVVALAGSAVTEPSLVRTQLGASVAELTQNTLNPLADGYRNRILIGSVFNGIQGDEYLSFVGQYTNQITCLPEGDTDTRTLGWAIPYTDKFSSILNVHFSALFRKKKQDFTTNLNGSRRAVISVGHLEQLTPLNIMPTQLMRALVTLDTDEAQRLGVLELDEEDVALFSYADIGKNEYGPALRDCLTKVEKDG